MKIGSFICVRNGFELDYCWELAAESLLKVCDELVLCDSDSTDGTREAMDRMADSDPRVKVVNWTWPNPVRESHHWFLRWLRFAQSHLTTDWCFYLDADEVLDNSPTCHQALRDAAEKGDCIKVDRLNYWRDAKSIIPDGHCCGKWCVRGGPTKYPVVSDEPHHPGEEPVVDNATLAPRIVIHHLGFLRNRDAFYAKAKVVLNTWFGRYDPRLEVAEKEGKNVWESECEFTNLLVGSTVPIPVEVQRWMSDRGHHTEKYVPMVAASCDPVIHVERHEESHPVNILHHGDFGDVIHMLPICRAIGSVNLYFSDRNSICKRILNRLDLIQPLLESQPYVKCAERHAGQRIHWHAGDFRSCHPRTRDQSLAESHWVHYQGQKSLPKISPQFSKNWISGIAPDPRSKGRIVIARTQRYNNYYFKWSKIVRHFQDRIIFVGLHDEHQAFCRKFGDVDYFPTMNLLEVAQLIAGSEFFIGNQSCHLAIAEALKHPRLAEVCPYSPDVIVSHHDNAQFSADGAFSIPPLCGLPALSSASAMVELDYRILSFINTPRSGWGKVLPGYGRAASFKQLLNQVKAKEGISDADAKKRIADAIMETNPGYFTVPIMDTVLDAFRAATARAKAMH